MTNKTLIIGLIISLMTFFGCLPNKKSESENETTELKSETESKSDEKYRKKFAGSYTIEVKGVSSDQKVEVYALNANGGASWLWVENDGKGGANVDDRKNGTWTATTNGITIEIKGNSGMITETYELKGDVLTNIQLPKRYLKKTE